MGETQENSSVEFRENEEKERCDSGSTEKRKRQSTLLHSTRRQFEEVLLEFGWGEEPNLECLSVHRKQRLFVSIYVDDIKMARKKQNTTSTWEKLGKNADLGGSISCLDHVCLGCTRRESKVIENVIDQYRENVRIMNYCYSNWKYQDGRVHAKTVAWSYDMERHVKKCVKRRCKCLKEKDATTVHSFNALLGWSQLQEGVGNSWRIIRCMFSKCFENACTWLESADLTFFCLWTNLLEQASNGQERVTDVSLVWFPTFITHPSFFWLWGEKKPPWEYPSSLRTSWREEAYLGKYPSSLRTSVPRKSSRPWAFTTSMARHYRNSPTARWSEPGRMADWAPNTHPKYSGTTKGWQRMWENPEILAVSRSWKFLETFKYLVIPKFEPQTDSPSTDLPANFVKIHHLSQVLNNFSLRTRNFSQFFHFLKSSKTNFVNFSFSIFLILLRVLPALPGNSHMSDSPVEFHAMKMNVSIWLANNHVCTSTSYVKTECIKWHAPKHGAWGIRIMRKRLYSTYGISARSSKSWFHSNATRSAASGFFLKKAFPVIILGFHVIRIDWWNKLRHGCFVLAHPCFPCHRSVQIDWLTWIEISSFSTFIFPRFNSLLS